MLILKLFILSYLVMWSTFSSCRSFVTASISGAMYLSFFQGLCVKKQRCICWIQIILRILFKIIFRKFQQKLFVFLLKIFKNKFVIECTYPANCLTSLWTSSRGGVVFNGLKNSIAWQAARSSIAITVG